MGFKKNYSVSDSSQQEPESGTKVAKHRNDQGMHWVTAAIFIVGDMMGGGMIALPIAFDRTGLLFGVTLTLLGAMFSGFTGVQLGNSWAMMQSRWSEYTSHCRRPYPEIGYRALGPKAKIFVSIALVATQFGIVVVLTLLSSKNLANFLGTVFGIQLSFCHVIACVLLLVWPFVMLKSPMDFWQAAIGAAVTSSIAAVIIVSASVHDSTVCRPVVHHRDFSVKSVLLGYGTIVFAYGGHGAFPTIQHDMRKPFRFNRSVIASYIFIVTVYLATGTAGYLTYGDSMRDTIIASMQVAWMSQAVNVMITLHVLPTIIIVFSPLAQQVEEWAHVSQDFGVQRVLCRSAILFLALFVGLSLPNFGVFLDLVGSSTISLMTMILPSIFYLFLYASKKKREEQIANGDIRKDSEDDQIASVKDIVKYTPKAVLAFNIISLIFGIVGGVAATYVAVSQLFESTMDTPCYIQWFSGGTGNSSSGGNTHCCGFNYTTTVSGGSPVGFCAEPPIFGS